MKQMDLLALFEAELVLFLKKKKTTATTFLSFYDKSTATANNKC